MSHFVNQPNDNTSTMKETDQHHLKKNLQGQTTTMNLYECLKKNRDFFSVSSFSNLSSKYLNSNLPFLFLGIYQRRYRCFTLKSEFSLPISYFGHGLKYSHSLCAAINYKSERRYGGIIY